MKNPSTLPIIKMPLSNAEKELIKNQINRGDPDEALIDEYSKKILLFLLKF